MNAVRLIALLSACAISLGVGQSALADDTNPTLPPTGTAAHDGPTAEELKNSKTRGIFFKVPGNAANFEVEKAAPVAAGTKAQTKHNGARKGPVHHPKTAHNAPATPAATAAVAHINSSTTDTTTASQAAVTPVHKTDQTKTISPVKKTAASHTGTKGLKTASQVNVASPTAIGASSLQGDAMIKAWLNKTGKPPCYKDGDKMEVTVNTSKDCNLVIYDFDGKGTLTQIFPNEYQKEGSVKAGDTVTIGGVSSNFEYAVSLADGSTNQEERLFIFAYPTKDEAPVSVAMTKIPSSPFRSAPMNLEQYRSLVNQSKVYFARSVTVKPKKMSISDIQNVADNINDGSNAPNKMELRFSVQK